MMNLNLDKMFALTRLYVMHGGQVWMATLSALMALPVWRRETTDKNLVSRVSTASLIRLHCELVDKTLTAASLTLESVQSFKLTRFHQDIEDVKQSLLAKHRAFRGWRRRGSSNKS
jgi:hypothetical protein